MLLIIIIFMLLTIFPVYFVFLPKVVWQIIYIGVPIVYLLVNQDIVRNRILKNIHMKRYQIVYMIFSVSFVYSLARIVFSNEGSPYLENYGLMLIGVVKFLAILIFLSKNVVKQNTLLEEFIKCYVLAICVYVAFSVLFLALPDVKLFWQSIVNMEGMNEDLLKNIINDGMYVTRFGLQGWTGFSASVFCSVGVWLNLILLINFKCSSIYTISLFVLLLGNSFYARSGLLISSVMLIIAFFYCYSRVISAKSLVRCFFLSLIAGSLFLFFYINDEYFILFNSWQSWLLNPVESFVDGVSHGSFSLGSSGDTLIEDMYYLPKEDYTIFLGDGLYINSDGSYYGHTDAGIMRNILFGGALGSALYYSIYFYPVKLLNDMGNHILGITVFSAPLVIMMIFFEIKGNPIHLYFGVIYALIFSCSIDYGNK